MSKCCHCLLHTEEQNFNRETAVVSTSTRTFLQILMTDDIHRNSYRPTAHNITCCYLHCRCKVQKEHPLKIAATPVKWYWYLLVMAWKLNKSSKVSLYQQLQCHIMVSQEDSAAWFIHSRKQWNAIQYSHWHCYWLHCECLLFKTKSFQHFLADSKHSSACQRAQTSKGRQPYASKWL